MERLSNIDEATTDNVEQWWEEITEPIKKCGEELCGRSTGKKKPGLESWWWNEEAESAAREKKERLNIWKRTGKENHNTAKGKAKSVMARVKAEAIQGLYDQRETVEGQQEIYRIAAARDRSYHDICDIRNVKRATGEVLTKDDESKERWGQYFNISLSLSSSFPFVRGEVLPATFSPPHLIVFSTLLCLLSSSSSLPLLLPSSHLS